MHLNQKPWPEDRRRGGAVIIVVLSLMSTLLVLGLFFYSWTSQERNSAEYFASAESLELDPDRIIDVVLRQAIVGPRPQSEEQSVLSGAHYSMLAHIFGTPLASGDELQYRPFPYSGRGMVVNADFNGDGFPDPTFNVGGSTNDTPGEFNVYYDPTTVRDQDNFILNFSRAANAGSTPAEANVFHSNAGYTYPDVNSMFLAFDEAVPLETTLGDTANRYRVVIPSYFRPQLFTRRRLDAMTGTGSGFEDYAENSNSTNKVLRPHSLHKAKDNSNSWTQNRYVGAGGTVAQSGDRNRLIGPFPFRLDANNNGVVNEMGIFSTTNLNNIWYELDGDVDRDGIRDSILLDIGHPIINLPGGRQVVPMAMMKWTDNDGLLNLNAHGNLSGLTVRRHGMNSGPFSVSNQGLSSFEVNLGLGLTADPSNIAYTKDTLGNLLGNHTGLTSEQPATRMALSNVELVQLLTGRMQFNSTGSNLIGDAPLLGRYGDSGSISAFRNWANGRINQPTPDLTGLVIPQPGGSGLNDDDDSTINNHYDDYGHPIDPFGSGNATQAPTGDNHGRVRRLTVNGKFAYPSYDEYWTQSRLPAMFSPTPISGTIIDEPDEVRIEPAIRNGDDALFNPSEIFALQGSDADKQASGQRSRVEELASYNFRDNRLAPLIRKRFTTDSWDRLEFSHRADNGNRSYEFNEWTSGGATLYPRAFPPEFGNDPVNSPTDPFRDSLRKLLSCVIDNGSSSSVITWSAAQQNGSMGQRININRVLKGIAANGIPNFTRLTEHPSIDATPPASGDQEFIARQERQQYARDIFVLLYVLGAPDSVATGIANFDPTSPDPLLHYPVTPATTYDLNNNGINDQVEQMAQFAVNLVDALDTDSVITQFEYDYDLSDGWNLDDDPFSDDTDTNPGAQRGVVRGVEAQLLTLSEVLFVHTEEGTEDSKTEWNDTADRSFSYIELQNCTPFNLTLNWDWQIRLEVAFGPVTAPIPTEEPLEMPAAHIRELTIGPATVNAGGRFVIGSAGDSHNQDAGVPRPSYMRVNEYGATDFTTIVPASGALDLDLITDNPTDDFRLIDGSITPLSSVTPITTLGDFFPPHVATRVKEEGGQIRVKLRRRLNPLRARPAYNIDAENEDNPWVEVDKVFINEIGVGTPVPGFALFDIGATFTEEMKKLKSRERPQPFDRRGENIWNGTEPMNPDPTIVNSFGEENENTPDSFNLWQPHFDRDFTSLAELFSIPLYGPEFATSRATTNFGVNARMSGYYNREAQLSPGDASRIPAVAGTLFLDPEEPRLPVAVGNRWHRLLEFLMVIPQNLQQYGDPSIGLLPKMRRTPGKVNLNLVRDESVLAALIDDPMLYSDTPAFADSSAEQNAGFDIGRNWYRELLRSRDMIDPFLFFGIDNGSAASPRIHIPGLVGSRPFQSTSLMSAPANQGQVDTVLRKNVAQTVPPVTGHPESPWGRIDGGADVERLHLFEARATADTDTSGTTGDQVDFHTRHRIFSKVLNNTTNRSHIFSGWIEIQFHDAHQISSGATAGAVQVGAKADDLPTYRQFVVVDMSRLEEAYNPSDNTFDFRKFIIHRQDLP
ncbi:hypothetical protein [Planctomicrobium sp. SH664]|uniref:hypothetical protein n=1 Tax=Planctomicrobium sp. SH664 TaxID=3448125 RepID=UPI003F5BD00B